MSKMFKRTANKAAKKDKNDQIKDLTERLEQQTSKCDLLSNQSDAKLKALQTFKDSEIDSLQKQLASLKEQLTATRSHQIASRKKKDMIIQQKDEELRDLKETLSRSSGEELEMRDSMIKTLQLKLQEVGRRGAVKQERIEILELKESIESKTQPEPTEPSKEAEAKVIVKADESNEKQMMLMLQEKNASIQDLIRQKISLIKETSKSIDYQRGLIKTYQDERLAWNKQHS